MDLDNCSYTGNYSYIKINSDTITLGVDFFGCSKLFYYQNNDLFIITNRYYLLLIIMKLYDVNLKICDSEIIKYLSNKTGMLSDQLINTNCIVEGTHLVKLNHLVKISKNVEFIENGLTNIISNTNNTPESYDYLLELSKREILSNVSNYVNSNIFLSYVCDLTGGVDSRLVVAALSNVTGAIDKVKLATGGNKKDIICANNVASIISFKYSDIYAGFRKLKWGYDLESCKLQDFSVSSYLDLISSYDIGTIFDSSTLYHTTSINAFGKLTGCAGEACTRPYMSNRFFNTSGLTKKQIINEFYSDIIDKICLSGKSGFSLVNEVSKQLDENDGLSINKKAELFLLFYRNRFHFDTAPKISWSIPTFSPLQSIHSFKALYSTLDTFNSYRLVFDLMYKLNQKISVCQYESLKDNISTAINHKNRSTTMIMAKKESSDWITCQNTAEEYKFLYRKFDNIYMIEDHIYEKDLYPYLTELNLSLLRTIFKSKLLPKKICYELFHLYRNLEKENQKFLLNISLYKKLSTIVYIYNLSSSKSKFNNFKIFKPALFEIIPTSKLFVEI